MIIAITPSPREGIEINTPKARRRLNPLKGDVAQTPNPGDGEPHPLGRGRGQRSPFLLFLF